jgi:hypothetical protein
MNSTTVIAEKTTFLSKLDETYNSNIKAEEKIKKLLVEFSNSPFDKNVWAQQIEGRIKPRAAAFIAFEDFDTQWIYLVKLWVIMESKTVGTLFNSNSHLVHFFKFLVEHKLTPRNITKNSLIEFQEWLDKYLKKDGKLLKGRTKWSYYNATLRFLSLLQGHPKVNTIKNVSIMVNPYPSSSKYVNDSEKERYEVISDEKLNILDEHFSNHSVPLHRRITYWLMRLYGVRPHDLENFPLECAKTLNKELGTLTMFVGKQGGATEKIDSTIEHPYKVEFIKLDEPKQKMLFELIKEQQRVASNLQKQVKKKGFLFTYRYNNISHGGVTVQSYTNFLGRYWYAKIRPLFPEGECPNPKSLKHTALTKRAIWGKFSHAQLRDVANHKSFDAIDNYVKPSKEKRLKMQERILMHEGKLSQNSFTGQSYHDFNNVKEKIMSDPYAHELPGWGWCPDASSCGNHFFCLGCESLVPNKKLANYYFEQAEAYIDKADRLTEMGKHVDSDDRMTTALQFYSLYQRTFDEGLEIEDGEE